MPVHRGRQIGGTADSLRHCHVDARHIRALHARRFATITAAIEAGVPVYAGTDAGGTIGHGLVGTEIAMLASLGGADFALGAASWRARDWLGAPPVADGRWADLVVYDTDPRLDPGITRHPSLVILRGRLINR